MRLGVLSDCHGNSLGLEKCLKYLRGESVELIYFLGDMVGYLPEVSKCYRLLAEYNVTCLAGNHDAMMSGVLPKKECKENIYLHEYAKRQLSKTALENIANWKSRMEIDLGARKILFVHGSPWDSLEEYIYRDSDLKRFDALEFDAVFMGHTHRPFVKVSSGGMLIANVGSCGLPRDKGNMAACAIYDTKLHSCEIYRLGFDVSYFTSKYEGELHETVMKCLNRKEELPIEGKVVEL